MRSKLKLSKETLLVLNGNLNGVVGGDLSNEMECDSKAFGCTNARQCLTKSCKIGCPDVSNFGPGTCTKVIDVQY